MNWEVEKRSSSCVKCEKEFFNNEEYYTSLVLTKKEPLRKDFCQDCWPAPEKKEDVFFWKGKYKKIEKEDKIDKKKIVEELFKEYLHATDEQHINFCYLLAVMLERKKVLIEKNKSLTNKASGKNLIVYEQSKTGEVFVVEDPEIDLREVASLQKNLKEILDQKGLKEVL
ncbi:hypothetical protein ACFLQ1_00340 [Candidatus Auribacterota bacterium]